MTIPTHPRTAFLLALAIVLLWATPSGAQEAAPPTPKPVPAPTTPDPETTPAPDAVPSPAPDATPTPDPEAAEDPPPDATPPPASPSEVDEPSSPAADQVPVPEDDPPTQPEARPETSAADVASAPYADKSSGVAVKEKDGLGTNLLWVPRVALYLPRQVVRLAFAPVRGFAYVWGKYRVGEQFNDAFYNDAKTFGIIPVISVDTGFGVNGGGRITHSNLFGQSESFTLRARRSWREG